MLVQNVGIVQFPQLFELVPNEITHEAAMAYRQSCYDYTYDRYRAIQCGVL